MRSTKKTTRREDAGDRRREDRVVVLDMASWLRRSDVAPRSRARRKPVLGIRALWELRCVFEMRRRIKREIAIRRASLGARSAARRAARRRELMSWACCPDDELALVLALEKGTSYGDSPARNASKADISAATIARMYPIQRRVRSSAGYSPGASYSDNDPYSLDAS